ncbi:hypothetical protein IFM89_037288 [Coptis chinensis]|uniref:Cytochrome P450 n=1 Tax=Coptis chinensis TaxID=261450 RepID=A0A835I3L7_9MAGN|nr:hypothetical protein IFM89_037288 [Coptis chinensis]
MGSGRSRTVGVNLEIGDEPIRAMRYLNVSIERKLKYSITQVHEFANRVITTRKKELSLELPNKKLKSDLLTIFIRLKDDEGKPFSDTFLRNICVNFILAGRDTSSVALSWFFWLLVKHPEVEKRILEEIQNILCQRARTTDMEDLADIKGFSIQAT